MVVVPRLQILLKLLCSDFLYNLRQKLVLDEIRMEEQLAAQNFKHVQRNQRCQ